jgi:hypothetical protein
MGIEGVLPTEDLDAKNILFEVTGSTCQGLGDGEAQELPMSWRIAKVPARKNLLQYEVYRFDRNLGKLAGYISERGRIGHRGKWP